MADFITVAPGPLSINPGFAAKIPGIPARVNTSVDLLEVQLRNAPTGQAVIAEAYADTTLLGTVTVAAGAVFGSTVIATTVSAGQVVTWQFTQVGSGAGDDVGATATMIVREA